MFLPPLVYWQGARWQEQEEYKTKIFWNLENWLKSVYSFSMRAYGPLEISLHDYFRSGCVTQIYLSSVKDLLKGLKDSGVTGVEFTV